MIVGDFSTILNLRNWIKGLSISSSIKFDEKSSYFKLDNVYENKNIDIFIDVNEATFYNYIYNYFYFVQEYIRKYESNFTFSNYTNINEIKSKYTDITSIEAQVFLETIIEEGIENIESFINKINMYDYDEEGLFSIFKYYNFLIEDSVENDHIAQDVFLIDGIVEPFKKANYSLISKDFTIENGDNQNISIKFDEKNNFEWIISQEDKNSFNLIIENDIEKSAEQQTLLI